MCELLSRYVLRAFGLDYLHHVSAREILLSWFALMHNLHKRLLLRFWGHRMHTVCYRKISTEQRGVAMFSMFSG